MRKGLFLFTVLLFLTNQLFAQCDTVSNWLPTDTANIYALGSFGYLTGSGNATYDAFAEKFAVPSVPDTLTDVLLHFGVASGNPNFPIKVSVWNANGTSGRPGTLLTSVTLPLIAIDTSKPTWFHFDDAPVISGDYFISYEIPSNIPYYDTVALYHTQDEGVGTSSAWARNAFGPWFPLSDSTFTYQFNISLDVQPVFCSSTTSYPLWVSTAASNVTACAGDTTTLFVNAQFGSGTYQYQWYPATGLSNPNIASPVLTVPDSTSSYYVRVIDPVNNDTAFGSALTFNPLSVRLDTSNAGCSFASTPGGLAVDIVSGAFPYLFSWSNGSTVPSITSVSGGVYSVTVTDSNGCVQTLSGNIVKRGVDVTLDAIPDTCNRSVGAVSISSNGQGFGQVGWIWANGSADSIVTGLSSGTYQISIRDTANGCDYQQSIGLSNACGSISGRVFVDGNQNGVYDQSVDVPLAGVTVRTPGGNVGVSGADGIYYVVGDTVGMQLLSIDRPYSNFCTGVDYYLFGTPVNGQHLVQITSPSQSIFGQDFTLHTPPSVSCGFISGHLFEDLDSNGIQGSGEPDVGGMRVMIDSTMVISNSDGNYRLSVPLNHTYDVSLLPLNGQTFYCGYNQNTNPFRQMFPANGQGYSVTLNTVSPNSSGNNFHLSSSQPGYDAGIYNISPYSINEPGETFTVYMDFKRIGEFTSDCTIRVEFDSTYLTLQGASLPIHDSGPGFVEFYFPANSTISSLCMGMVFSLSPNVPAGHVFTWTAYFTCDVADYCSANDTLTRSVTYAGVPKKPTDDDLGYTFMRSFPNTQLTEGYIDRNDTIFNYLIQIQNTTGDTVRHLIVTDTLPSHLRVESVSLPFSPKSFDFQIDENGAMLIEFENIVLPDSSQNFDKSCLFIQYNVVLKGGLPGGTVIRNRAAAYFNYSDVPVFTNYAVNKIAWLDGVEPLNSFEFHVYPNPNNGTFMLQLDKAYDNATLTITNLAGMTVLDMDISGEDKQAINLHEQGSGVYFVEVVSNGLRQVKKIVVTH